MKVRWLVGAVLLLVLFIAIYLGTALVAVRGLVQAASAGNTATLMERTDLPRFRKSVADQLVKAYYHGIEKERPIKTVERMLAPAVVEAILSALITPEAIMLMLQRGTLRTLRGETIVLPALSEAKLDDTGTTLRRMRPKSPMQLQVLIEGETAIRLHYEATHWKLSGIDLPRAAAQKLVASFAAR